MRLNTIVTLGASIAFGLGGVLLARGWINSAIENEFRAVASTDEDIAQPAEINTVPVIIADADLVFGDILSRDVVRVVNYPEDAVPNGSFSNIETIFSSGDEHIVLTSLAFNEPILDHKITGPNGKASLSARITSGYRAVSIRVDDVTGVAGFVVPGDVVDIIYTREPEANNSLAKSQASSVYLSDIILQNITVLGVNQNQSQATSDANVARTVTLEVSNEDGQALNLAMKQGTLSLSLRAVGETVPAQSRQMKLSDLGQKKAHRKTPTRPRKFVKKVTKKQPSNVSQVTVIRLRENETETVERLEVKREQTLETTANQLSELAGG